MPKAIKKQKGLLDTWGRRNRKLQDKICKECGLIFRPYREQSKYCSIKCLWKNNGGHNKKQESWWKNNRGYIEGRIWLPDGTQIRVKQHRFVMEGILGRPLLSTEDVHHINGNKSDNRPINLEIITHSQHTTNSNKKRIYKKGYRLNLTNAERKSRSLRAIAIQLYRLGQQTINKAEEAL